MDEKIKNLSYEHSNLEFITHLTFGEDEFVHTHAFYEIFYVTEGKIYHICNNRKTLLKVGDAVILRPNDIHRFERVGDCTHRDITARTHLFKSACDYLDKSLYETINFGIEPIKFNISSNQIANLEETLNYIKYMSPEVEHSKPFLVRSFLAHILGYIYFSDHVVEVPYPKWLNTLIQKLNEPAFLKEGISAIKREFNYNYIYICRVFKKYMNMVITDYINIKRLELSKLYLTTTKMNITEISEEVGFNYPYRFNQLFKEHNGCTPSQYRKEFYHPD